MGININNLPLNEDGSLADETTAQDPETVKFFSSVGSLPQDDRKDLREPERISAEAWKKADYFAVTIKCDPGDAAKTKKMIAKSYDEYAAARQYIHEKGYFITGEDFQTEAEYLPGFLTYESAVKEFMEADYRYLHFRSFPRFSDIAKIKVHDSVAIAADTGAGKSSLAINFLNDLNDEYPIIYFNLEMDALTILQRLVSIHTGLEIDRVDGYKKDEKTEAAVNSTLRALTKRKPLQILRDVYTLESIEKTIAQATEGREDPTIVFIDHSLLVKTEGKQLSRYERFTYISEELRRIARLYNIVMFVLLQQSRNGKSNKEERPENDSLKESGSWENDATHIIFLWFDPNVKKKKLILTKCRRGGNGSEFTLNYIKETQEYRETKEESAALNANSLTLDGKGSKRDKRRERLDAAIISAIAQRGAHVTLMDVADADGNFKNAEAVRKEANDLGGYLITPVEYDDKGKPKKSSNDLIAQGTTDNDEPPEEWTHNNSDGSVTLNLKDI